MTARRLILVLAAPITIVVAAIYLMVSDLWRLDDRIDPAADGARQIALLPTGLAGFSIVEVTRAGAGFKFERDPSGAWFLHRHAADAPADTGHQHVPDPRYADRIADSLGKFAASKGVLAGDLAAGAALGLQNPMLIVAFHQDGLRHPTARYMIGDAVPGTESRYALNVDANLVMTVPQTSIAGLIALLDEIAAAPPGAAP